jgi:MerR family transcriptional regulator, light-induced transcriptional regulator
MADNTPVYNLKAVINEVGLKPATLRAWERRYGLLKPERSPGGHRLYSRQDIDMLKWLIERQKEGLSISSAAEMWKSQQIDKDEISQTALTQVQISATGETILDELRQKWLSACMDFDDQTANQILDHALSVAAPELILSHVLQNGIAEIGERWYAGVVSVQQEHFATAIAVRRVNALLAGAAPSTRSGRILVACPPGEDHDFILLMITFFLKRRGWDVVYLGSNVPLINLDATIRSTSPILFISAAQTLNSAASLRVMSEYMVTQGIPLAYGGSIFNDIPATTRYISGYFLGNDVANVAQMVEQLVTERPPLPSGLPVPLQYTQTLKQFIQNEGAIATHVSSIFRSEPVDPAQLDNMNTYLGQFIASALTLGDINLLDNSIFWLNGLLQTYDLSAALVRQYYTTYHLEVEHLLGDHGSIIQNQLAKYEISV